MFLCPLASKKSWSHPHSTASQLPLLSCFMRKLLEDQSVSSYSAKSYLQKEEGMRREAGVREAIGVGVVVAIEIEKCN